VRTNTNGFSFGETSNWVTLPGASIQWTVPAGQTDLFNVAFSAETRMDSGDTEDYIRIRILDNGVPMEPYDGFQAFFSSRGYGTHKGNWARPAQAGNHTLTVQFWIQDGPPSHTLFAFVDDWTFELVVYD
jgi:hypothetical protein